jgi:MFS transporter, ACS family, tartrate transporter
MSGPANVVRESLQLELPAAVSETAVMRKVSRRLIPFLFLLYVINILDRANIGVVKKTLVDDLEIIGKAAFGLGAGIFYVGYVLFEVPSNLMLARMGARRWMARILVSWGLVSICMLFVRGPWSFYALRILLGVAEAGFFPGIILYLSHWFPARERARAVATFMTASLIATIVGNPVGKIILQHLDQTAGLAGWQWVFLLEGLPAIVLGFITLSYLTDRPEEARWLTAEERDWLARRMAEEESLRSQQHGLTMMQALADVRVWLLIGVYFTVATGENAYGFYLVNFLEKRFPDWEPVHIGFLAVVPAATAMIVMVLVGAHSDRTGERRWHVAGSAFLAALGWTLAAVSLSPWFFVFALMVTSAGMKSMLPTFWSLPTSFLSGTAAAGGIALINSVANLGGLLGPTIIGQVEEATGAYSYGMATMAVILCAGGALVLFVRHDRTLENKAALSSTETR